MAEAGEKPCPFCGNKIPASATLCAACGARLETAAPPATPAETPPATPPGPADQAPPPPQPKERPAPGGQAPPADSRDGLALAALIVGCVSIVSSCCGLCGLPFPIIGIILGIMGLKAPTKRNLAMIGLILSIVALIMAIIFAVIGVLINLGTMFGANM